MYSGCRNASILDDMEPSTVLHLLKEQFPKSYWFFENAVKSENSRSKRAKNLIECLSYFMDHGDILNCVYGKKRVLESGKEHRIKRTENQKREGGLYFCHGCLCGIFSSHFDIVFRLIWNLI